MARTTERGDEVRLTRDAIARGFRRIVAVGGDGTWSHVAGAILDSGEPVELALIAGGTGCDFAKSLGIPARDVAAAAQVALSGATRVVDVGRIENRWFINVAGFGLDIAVLERSWSVRWLSGDLVYPWCAVQEVFAYPGFETQLAFDDQPAEARNLVMLILANARQFGGLFPIAPDADLSDGAIDAVGFRNCGPARRALLLGKLLAKRHEADPLVSTRRFSRLRLSFSAPPTYETDGEWNRAQSRELEVTSVPQALRVLVPAP
jgi:diacylglycerol kinase (ATP)